jgi:hypothetical protein
MKQRKQQNICWNHTNNIDKTAIKCKILTFINSAIWAMHHLFCLKKHDKQLGLAAIFDNGMYKYVVWVLACTCNPISLFHKIHLKNLINSNISEHPKVTKQWMLLYEVSAAWIVFAVVFCTVFNDIIPGYIFAFVWFELNVLIAFYSGMFPYSFFSCKRTFASSSYTYTMANPMHKHFESLVISNILFCVFTCLLMVLLLTTFDQREFHLVSPIYNQTSEYLTRS